MSAPKVKLLDSRLVVRNAFTRLPFRFGVITMKAAPVGLLECTFGFENGSYAKGVASDFLAYKWFDKNPDKTPADNVNDLLQAVQDARVIYAQAGAETAFNLWLNTRQPIEEICLSRGFNRLGASFACSMMERAAIDATGRHLGLSFDAMVRRNTLDLRPNEVLGEVRFSDILEALPDRPLEEVALRHTVGLVDPIARNDKTPDDPHDGLPVSLEDYLEVDQLSYLKIKVSGDADADTERLCAIARIIGRSDRPIKITLDGNEQYKKLEDFVSLIDRIRSTPELETLWRAVLFIEQPLHRDVAMSTQLSAAAKTQIDRPLLIDEADGWAEAYSQAIDLGYEGVSHKNCKGIYRSLINTGLAHRRNQKLGAPRYFLSAEDLTNLASVPLQADLAVVATLGITHVERNGHHYFHGLDHLPPAEARRALADHPDLYQLRGSSATLRIDHGMLNLASLQVSGLGVKSHPDLNQGIPEDDWRFSMLENRP